MDIKKEVGSGANLFLCLYIFDCFNGRCSVHPY